MEFKGQYLTYNEYKSLGGNLNQTPFNLLEYEARKKIDERTLGRLKKISEIPEEVKMCVLTLTNTLNSYLNENTNNKNVASESVGSYSVSYATGNQIQEIIKSKSVEINDIILTHLTGVIVNGEHLVYLGVC